MYGISFRMIVSFTQIYYLFQNQDQAVESKRSKFKQSEYQKQIDRSKLEWRFLYQKLQPVLNQVMTFQQLRLSSFQMLIWRKLEAKANKFKDLNQQSNAPQLSRDQSANDQEKQYSSAKDLQKYPSAKEFEKTSMIKDQLIEQRKSPRLSRKQSYFRSSIIKNSERGANDAANFYRIQSQTPQQKLFTESGSKSFQRSLSFTKSSKARISPMRQSKQPSNFKINVLPVSHSDHDFFAYKSESSYAQDEVDLQGECYISFQKLLKDQLKLFDRKDSSFLTSQVYFDKNQEEKANKQYISAKSQCKVVNQKQIQEGKQINFEVFDQDLAEKKVGFDSTVQKKDTLNARRLLKHFQSDLWLSGQVIGSISGSLEIQGVPLLHQMMFGVCTQNGVKIGSVGVLHDFSQLDIKSSRKQAQKLPEQIKKLYHLKQNLILYHQAQKHPHKKRPTVLFIQQVLQNMSNLLDQSDKQSMLSFFYQNQTALLQAQELLIQLGYHFLQFSDFVRYQFRNWYFIILEKIFKRGELDLAMMAYKVLSQNLSNKSTGLEKMISNCKLIIINLSIYLQQRQNLSKKKTKRQFFTHAFSSKHSATWQKSQHERELTGSNEASYKPLQASRFLEYHNSTAHFWSQSSKRMQSQLLKLTILQSNKVVQKELFQDCLIGTVSFSTTYPKVKTKNKLISY